MIISIWREIRNNLQIMATVLEYLFTAAATKPEEKTIVSPNVAPVAGEGLPRRGAHTRGKPLSGPPVKASSGWELFDVISRRFPTNEYLGYRPIVNDVALPYVWETYAQVRRRVENVSGALAHKGFGASANVGIYSINCPEWMVTALACFRRNCVPVPLYDTLGEEAMSHIISQTDMEIAFASLTKLAGLFEHASRFTKLKTIVTYGEPTDEQADQARSLGIELLSFFEFEKMGSEHPCDPTPPSPDSIAVICYTSGTTGTPKGAMLTHKNVLSCSHSVTLGMRAGKFPEFPQGGTHLSYLPLAHSFEFVNQFFAMAAAGRVGFYQGNPLKIMDDLQTLKPSCFVSVPRLLNRIYDKVWAGVRAKGGLAETLFRTAYASKVEWLKSGYNKSMVFDTVVFSKLNALLGGNVKFILTGSAPLSTEVMQFLRVCFSMDIIEGYGQTECATGATMTWCGDYEGGHVGSPLSCNEIKLIDVPSMNYTSNDKPNPRGEICIRGNNVFQGYYKEPEKTAEALDKDGWVHTGDVGMWDSNGRLVVIDRVKNLFKLSQGEYVSPERVEGVYQSHPIVAQAFVYGNSLKSCTIAVIVPDEAEFTSWAVTKEFLPAGTTTTDMPALLARTEVVAAANKALQDFGREAGLKGFENVRAAHWDSEMWSVDNNLLTPTFKLKRIEAKAKYQDVLDGLYVAISE
ncbi:hypothetical protein BC828DRAFT_373620 [Blastocladiella britannica]|nr:hypothetical protein BC828DRAFT_373620 [Blastocladiella britannica]